MNKKISDTPLAIVKELGQGFYGTRCFKFPDRGMPTCLSIKHKEPCAFCRARRYLAALKSTRQKKGKPNV